MANASDSLGYANSSASAPIDLFSLADADAMVGGKPNAVNKIDQAGSRENSKGNPKAAAKAEKIEE